MRVVNSRGNDVPLGPLLGRGGEGAVYDLANRPGTVAKVYHDPLTSERAGKIAAMARLPSDPLLRIAAWPTDTLHERTGGPVVGLLMPKVTGHQEVNVLYSPKNRLTAFTRVTWRFLIHAAANAARAFAVVHAAGHVIGDVNEKNLLVSDDATVMLIDCDSFQIAASGRTYPCDVGAPLYQPPEITALPTFRGVARTPNHDNLGLAILVFHLLFQGRHPFAGRYHGPGEMPIERAIREYRFAYGAAGPSRQMEPPPLTLPFDAVSPFVTTLFDRAFSPAGSRPDGRPAARDWVQALDLLGSHLTTCWTNPGHEYPIGAADCPWCAIEGRTGVVFFTVRVARAAAAGGPSTVTLDIAAVWATIAAVPGPGPAPAPPAAPAIASAVTPRRRRIKQRRKYRRGAALVLVAASLAVVGVDIWWEGLAPIWVVVVAVALAWLVDKHKDPEMAAIEREVRSARTEVDRLLADWQRETAKERFLAELRDLERAKGEYENLAQERVRRLHALDFSRRETRLQRFLEQHRVTVGRVQGIGQGRVATLRSFGIETAADVDARSIERIPGFGPHLTASLVAWRYGLERGFVYNPNLSIDPRDVQRIEAEIAASRRHLEQTLKDGPSRLRHVADDITLKRATLFHELEKAQHDLALATAELG